MTIRSIEIVPLGYARRGSALYYVIILFRALASVREQKPTAAGFFSNLISLAVEVASKMFSG